MSIFRREINHDIPSGINMSHSNSTLPGKIFFKFHKIIRIGSLGSIYIFVRFSLLSFQRRDFYPMNLEGSLPW
jgi:hypothetical protein